MNKILSTLVAVATLVVAADALAAIDLGSMPKLKTGLWVTTVNNEGMPPATHSMCIDEATQQRLLTLGLGMMTGLCSKSDVRRHGDAIVFDSECALGPMRVKSAGRTTFSGSVAYSTETTTRFDPPMMGRETVRSIASGRHMGACPDGMRPGDMRLPDGRVVNIDDLPGLVSKPR